MPTPKPDQLKNVDPKVRDYVDAVRADMDYIYGGAIDALKNRIATLETGVANSVGELTGQIKRVETRSENLGKATGRTRGIQ